MAEALTGRLRRVAPSDCVEEVSERRHGAGARREAGRTGGKTAKRFVT